MNKRTRIVLFLVIGVMVSGISCQTQSLSQRATLTGESAKKTAMVIDLAPVSEQKD
jgi:hypothetical protein